MLDNDKEYTSLLAVDTPATMRQRVPVAMGLAPYRAAEQATLLDEARRRGWRWHLARDNRPAGEHTRGAIVDWLPNDERVKILRQMGCKVVRLGRRPHPADNELPAVLPDLYAAGRTAAEHFYDRSFHDVAFFGHSPWAGSPVLFDGFRERSGELGMTCHLYQIVKKKESPREESERQSREFLAWVEGLPRPVGLFAPGAAVAANFCSLLLDAGVEVPEDVAILAGADSRVFCECMTPSISAINSTGGELLHAACDLLEGLMNKTPIPETPLMIAPVDITERESTRVLATQDKLVGAARRYMWDNLDRNISVEDIATAVGLSSRQLKRRFRAALKSGINEEFRRLRLKEFKRLLRVTNHTIEELAPLVGFQSKVYLHRAFRKAFGMTPTDYRRHHNA